jgi:hypothetical protein
MIDYDKIPPHMMKNINDYVENGSPLGGFLRAVFANDFIKAVCSADAENFELIKTYASYVNWEVPYACHGSYEKVKEWMKNKREEQKNESK